MSSLVIEEEEEAAKGMLVLAMEVKESRVARPNASKPCTHLKTGT